MTPAWTKQSILVLALEASGHPALTSQDGRVYVRCPWTRWHADVDIKLATIEVSPASPDVQVLRCEICGNKSASEVLQILPARAVMHALDLWDAAARDTGPDDPVGGAP